MPHQAARVPVDEPARRRRIVDYFQDTSVEMVKTSEGAVRASIAHERLVSARSRGLLLPELTTAVSMLDRRLRHGCFVIPEADSSRMNKPERREDPAHDQPP